MQQRPLFRLNEPDRFHDTQPAPVEELGDHLGGAVHEREYGGDFFAGHDHGDGDLLDGAHGIDTARHRMAEAALGETHHRAFIAWFWVAGATLPFTAKSVRNASIFGSAGKRPSRDRRP